MCWLSPLNLRLTVFVLPALDCALLLSRPRECPPVFEMETAG
ncbi:hypothetical protein Z950_1379 [Sulfitobacter mediterraneus KCTC 32188]|nr:hypothetical protein Z950_1379 [Sulfitobacter mediterraneus KCTC 32188]